MNHYNNTITYENQIIKFNYPNHEIDGIVLAEFLISLNKVLQEVRLQYPDCPDVKIVVTTHQKGSFELIYSIAEHIPYIDGQRIISVVKDIVTCAISLGKLAFAMNQIWEFIAKIKDKKIINEIDKGDTIEILTDTGDVYIQNKKEYKVYKSPITKKAINKIFLVLNQEKDRNALESIEFKTLNSKPIIFKKEEFQVVYNLTLQKNDRENNKYELIQQQTLIADSLHLTGKRKWGFFWNGVKFNFVIDKLILKTLQSKRIGKKDQLIVDITIEKEFDENINDFKNKKYTITKLYEIVIFEDFEQSLFK